MRLSDLTKPLGWRIKMARISTTVLALIFGLSLMATNIHAVQAENFPSDHSITLSKTDAEIFSETVLKTQNAVGLFGDLTKQAGKGTSAKLKADMIAALETIQSHAQTIYLISKHAENDAVMKLASQFIINDDIAGKIIINDDILGRQVALGTAVTNLKKLVANLESINLVVSN